jgi:hypothetical protein
MRLHRPKVGLRLKVHKLELFFILSYRILMVSRAGILKIALVLLFEIHVGRVGDIHRMALTLFWVRLDLSSF